ncbi:HTH_8 domain-containing protein [Vibrio chagasii]|nr:HTH_8 domain-containing protein [Vibrio chagasii]
MNDQPTPINKDHLKKLIRAELELTWFDNKSDSPDMSWVTPTVIETLFTELITHTRGNQLKAARMLGINRGSFSKKLNQITSNELGLVESL